MPSPTDADDLPHSELLSSQMLRLLEELVSQHLREMDELRAHGSQGEPSHTRVAETRVEESMAVKPLPARPSDLVQPQDTVLVEQTVSAQRVSELDLSAPVIPADEDDEDGADHGAGKCSVSRVRAFLSSDRFEITISALIMMNVFVMGAQLEYDGLDVGYFLGYPKYDRQASRAWPSADAFFYVSDVIFSIVFSTDVLLRIGLLGMRFWKVALNWLDFLVLILGIVAYAGEGLNMNPTFLRLLRLGKLGRGLRALQMSPVVQALQLLLKCLSASVNVLGWSLCVLFVIQSIAGILLCNLLRPVLQDESIDLAVRHRIFRYYGTFTNTMLTMFEILFANWSPPCRVLTDNVSEWWGLAFICYRCFVGFAVLNVVNAVFVQSTMKVAQNDNDIMIAQKQKEKRAYEKKLHRLFRSIDESGDGRLSKDEFMPLINDPKMKAWLSALEIDTHDLDALFTFLAVEGDDQISTEDFIHGIFRLKGPAKAFDMAELLSVVHRIDKKLVNLATSPPPLITSTRPLPLLSLSVTVKPETVVAQPIEEKVVAPMRSSEIAPVPRFLSREITAKSAKTRGDPANYIVCAEKSAKL